MGVSGVPGAEVTNGCELSYGWWELNWRPSKEQPALVSPAPMLRILNPLVQYKSGFATGTEVKKHIVNRYHETFLFIHLFYVRKVNIKKWPRTRHSESCVYSSTGRLRQEDC